MSLQTQTALATSVVKGPVRYEPASRSLNSGRTHPFTRR